MIAVQGYLAHVEVERGLSPHTVQAYRRDLERYLSWCADHGIVAVEAITENDVADFAAEAAAQARVLVRPYGNEGARVSIGAPEENDAFLRFAAAWISRATGAGEPSD